MKTWRLICTLLACLLAASLGAAQSLTLVYWHDFKTVPGGEWSKRYVNTTPNGQRTFLGQFGAEEVTLELDELEEHSIVKVTFELFIINTWEGSVGFNSGPDIWDLNVFTPSDCCELENLIHTTFANCDCDYQAFPANHPDARYRGLTAADEVNTLGYPEDSVYYLTFTFFHTAPNLAFRFSATPHLQALDDESWGIDNIYVEMDYLAPHSCTAQRELPAQYGAGYPVPVTITVEPDDHVDVVESLIVEETPPADWPVTDITNGGVFDSTTGIIKWGPFMDAEARVLSYTTTPPSWVYRTFAFDGFVSINGESEMVCGDAEIGPGSYHPADTDEDWRMEADEVTAYGAAWAKGEGWPSEPSPIPASYVTNAGLLWYTGEAYLFDGSQEPPWVAGGTKSAGTAVAGVSTMAGGGLLVSLAVTPDAGTHLFAVEDMPPAGWTVSSISDGGQYDANNAMVKWGLFTGDSTRTLSYVLTPALGAGEMRTFAGSASFDGSTVAVRGVRVFPGRDPVTPI